MRALSTKIASTGPHISESVAGEKTNKHETYSIQNYFIYHLVYFIKKYFRSLFEKSIIGLIEFEFIIDKISNSFDFCISGRVWNYVTRFPKVEQRSFR